VGTFTSVNELRLCGSPAQTCRWCRQAGFQIPNGQKLYVFRKNQKSQAGIAEKQDCQHPQESNDRP
jgi:hypothetical protein